MSKSFKALGLEAGDAYDTFADVKAGLLAVQGWSWDLEFPVSYSSPLQLATVNSKVSQVASHHYRGSSSTPLHLHGCKRQRGASQNVAHLSSEQLFALTAMGYHHFARCCAPIVTASVNTQLILVHGANESMRPLTRRLDAVTAPVRNATLEEVSYAWRNKMPGFKTARSEIMFLKNIDELIAAAVTGPGVDSFEPDQLERIASVARMVDFLLAAHRVTDELSSEERQAATRVAAMGLLRDHLGYTVKRSNPVDAFQGAPWTDVPEPFPAGATRSPSDQAFFDILAAVSVGVEPAEAVQEYITYENCVASRAVNLQVGQYDFEVTPDMVGRSLQYLLQAAFARDCVQPLQELRDQFASEITTYLEYAKTAGEVTAVVKISRDTQGFPEFANAFVTDYGVDTFTLTAPVVLVEATLRKMRERVSYRYRSKLSFEVSSLTSSVYDAPATDSIQRLLNEYPVKPFAATVHAAHLTLVAA